MHERSWSDEPPPDGPAGHSAHRRHGVPLTPLPASDESRVRDRSVDPRPRPDWTDEGTALFDVRRIAPRGRAGPPEASVEDTGILYWPGTSRRNPDRSRRAPNLDPHDPGARPYPAEPLSPRPNRFPRDASPARPVDPGAGRYPAGPRSRWSRATGWITAHWGGASRIPNLPVIAVAVAAVLALAAGIALVLVPSERGVPTAAGASAPVGGVVPTAQPAPTPQLPVSTVPRVARATTTGLFPTGVAAHSLEQANTWADFRGRPNDVVIMYTGRGSWNAITSPWIGHNTATFAGFTGTWVITQPLFPDSGPQKGNLVSCAAGAYDSYWRKFGRWLVAQGRGDSFVRLGWEFNGLWFAWAATDPQHWIQCFRHASAAIKATSPTVRIDWNLNAHGSTTPVGAFDLYPGDQYVDVIGVDSYDQYPPSPTAAAFDDQCNGDAGLCQVITFARTHNKLFSVPEWGVVSQQGSKAGRSGAAGGDNPVYVQKMYETFFRNADILAYEAYFSDAEPDNVRSSLVDPNLNPASAATYQRLWR
ncbi:glycoside hydrolase family 26 protein [Frankia sp. R82]|uniref:glycoside hydrolase family 26 protein n=1 Tax=Frankia sp. R82 TaxID=2950553 RepID=UPI002043118F|nr:glycosyl hydrolase [Frankia sp. R82]MCM3884016.1 hypothetical protein [Frankia sp. R82]